MEVEPRIAKAVQMPILLQLQKLPWKGDGGLKKKKKAGVFASVEQAFMHTEIGGCPQS